MNPAQHNKNGKVRITEVPTNVINHLEKLGAEVIRVEEDGNWFSMFWRFYAINDNDVAIFRDCDSRLSYREYYAVQEWLESNKGVHIMRDHFWHSVPILGGMWGLKKGVVNNIKKNIKEFVNNIDSANIDKSMGYWQCDQDYLKTCYKDFEKNAMIHSEYISIPSEDSKPFPKQRLNSQFVGQPYDENNKAIITLTGEMNKEKINEYFLIDNKQTG
jgi:hypothetical protein